MAILLRSLLVHLFVARREGQTKKNKIAWENKLMSNQILVNWLKFSEHKQVHFNVLPKLTYHFSVITIHGKLK